MALPDGGARNISRFSDYLHRVWRPGLASQGILPSQWMLTVAIDPMQEIIRGLYLGPKDAPPNAPLVRMEKAKKALAPLVPSSKGKLLATSGAWKPRKVRSIQLLSQNNPNFWTALLQALQWVTDSYLVEPSDLEPALAMELDKVYYRRRLYSAHGALYGVKQRREADAQAGGLDLAAMAPAVYDREGVPLSQFQPRCPVCGAGLEITCRNQLPGAREEQPGTLGAFT